LPEWLGFLWRIDRSNADLYLFIGSGLATSSGQRVSIGDGDDKAKKDGRGRHAVGVYPWRYCI
jgi:hypothetical protein